MFDQSYQQLYVQKQVISLEHSYPCPRCKSGLLKPFGETETFSCEHCERKFVALNAGRILHPARRLRIKIAPVFWWDGTRWHLAGTTASPSQNFLLMLIFVVPMIVINAFVFFINHGHLDPLDQHLVLNLALLNGLVAFFMAQLFYLFCWDQNWSNNFGHNRRLRH